MSNEYVITSDKSGLPKGTSFYVLPAVPAPGQLVMFSFEGFARIGVGRWMPDICGYNWIRQPGRLIAEVPPGCLIIHGAVVPVEDPPKEITDLSTSECGAALPNTREARG